MKKVICFVLVTALLLSFAGCGGKGDVLSATGKYNGQRITMTYKVTDVSIHSMAGLTCPMSTPCFLIIPIGRSIHNGLDEKYVKTMAYGTVHTYSNFVKMKIAHFSFILL